MMYPLLLAAVVACGCAAVAPGVPPAATDGDARIDVERGDPIIVRALFDGASAGDLTYRLEVLREGTAGRSQSSQGGTFSTAAGRTDTLSTVQVSAGPGDRLEARLVVQRGDVTVSETRFEETVGP